MATFLTFVVQTVIPALTPIILGLAGLWINSARKNQDAAASKNSTDEIIARVNHLAAIVISNATHKLVPVVNSAAADGKITTEEIDGIKKILVEELKAYLTPAGLIEIAKQLGITPDKVTDYLLGVITDKILSTFGFGKK